LKVLTEVAQAMIEAGDLKVIVDWVRSWKMDVKLSKNAQKAKQTGK
jgi:hypothetical protein